MYTISIELESSSFLSGFKVSIKIKNKDEDKDYKSDRTQRRVIIFDAGMLDAWNAGAHFRKLNWRKLRKFLASEKFPQRTARTKKRFARFNDWRSDYWDNAYACEIREIESLSRLQIDPDTAKTMPLALWINWNYQQPINLSVGGKTVWAQQTYLENLENLIGSEVDDVNLETERAINDWGSIDIISIKENDNVSPLEKIIVSEYGKVFSKYDFLPESPKLEKKATTCQDVDLAPDVSVFYGRVEELATLKIDNSLKSNVAILKPGGKYSTQVKRSFQDIGSNKTAKDYIYRERTKTMAA